MHAYVARARLRVGWAYFEKIFKRNITTLENMLTPLFDEPLKFIAHWYISERLGYKEKFISMVSLLLQYDTV